MRLHGLDQRFRKLPDTLATPDIPGQYTQESLDGQIFVFAAHTTNYDPVIVVHIERHGITDPHSQHLPDQSWKCESPRRRDGGLFMNSRHGPLRNIVQTHTTPPS